MSSRPNFSQSNIILWVLGLLFLFVLVASLAWRIHSGAYPDKAYDEQLIAQPEEMTDPGSAYIEAGILVNNIYNFEASQKTFDADGWVWLTWPSDVDRAMKQHGVLPKDVFYFFNQINGYDALLIAADLAPKQTPDGRHYAKFQFSGHFFSNKLDFRKFPFQTLNFPLALELHTPKRLGLDHPVTLKVDHQNSGLGAYVDLGGYITKGFKLGKYKHTYESSLGDPYLDSEPRTVSQLRMEVFYQKNPMVSVFKILVPMIAVTLISLLSASITPLNTEVRLSIPPTAILSLIFLQKIYQDWLPELPYITFLDTIYNLCYLANLILFGLYLWGSNTLSRAPKDQRFSVAEQIAKYDSRVQRWLMLAFILAIPGNWFGIGLVERLVTHSA